MPTIVYKYRLWAPTTNQDVVTSSFLRATQYYNALVIIENRRRAAYQQSRSSLFPDLEQLEQEEKRLDQQVRDLQALIKNSKSKKRTRDVDLVDAEKVKSAKLALKAIRLRARATRGSIKRAELEKCLPRFDEKRAKFHDRATKCENDLATLPAEKVAQREDASRILAWCKTKIAKIEAARSTSIETIAKLSTGPEVDTSLATELVARADAERAVSEKAVKDLRKSLYWGTYLLVEEAVKQAAKMTPGFLKLKTLPNHQQPGRIGIQIMGGISPDKLTTDTRIQIHQDGRNGTCRLRVGTVENTRDPLWAEFPIRMHRPLPKDAQIMWSVVTRVPGHLLRPWIYHLCLTIRTSQVAERPNLARTGTCAVNFGWRLTKDNTLRVATLNVDSIQTAHLELPSDIYRRFDKCKDLQSILDDNFNQIKKDLSTWILEHLASLPQAFLESFENLQHWRSARMVFELVDYWQNHRLPNDQDIFEKVWYWRGRYFHLQQWLTGNRTKALRARLDYYRKVAREIAITREKIIIEAFDMSQVATRPPAEMEDTTWQKARENRTRASCHELRLCIVQACAKYGTKIVLVKAENNTRRCNVCGKILEWNPARELVRQCPDCSTWDQDINNTDNSHDSLARGEVTTLVEPAKVTGDREISPPVVRSYRAARKEIPNSPKSL